MAVALLTIIPGGYVLWGTALAVSLIGLGELYRAVGVWKKDSKGLAITGFVAAALYYVLLLLGLEEPLCTAFAKVMRDTWGVRRPKDPYRIASYQKLSKGFRDVIMGIDVTDFMRRREKEAEEEEF